MYVLIIGVNVYAFIGCYTPTFLFFRGLEILIITILILIIKGFVLNFLLITYPFILFYICQRFGIS